MNSWLHIIQDWLYPPTCLLCGDPGADGRDLCRDCALDLPYNRCCCPRCGLPLAAESATECGECQRKPPQFDASVAAFRYEEPVRHLIQDLKFHSRYPASRVLGSLLADHLAQRENRPQCLIPVPLHPARYRSRGFNQSIEIAREVSTLLRVPLDLGGCVRVRATLPQAELSAAERQRNLRNAFKVLGNYGGLHVALLDDVMTTGATMNELARALRKAGARRIEAWACARA
jgi:ComF family protein